jgi:hypothetical protein
MYESDVITESNVAQNVAFTLNSNELFFPTGYKVLSRFGQGSLLKCAKYNYNGKIKLLYFSAGYRSLSSMLSNLNENSFTQILTNLFNAFFNVRGNGFLTCSNINISPDFIFIDQNTLSVHLIYLPINMHDEATGSPGFENEVRAVLLKVIQNTPTLATPNMRRIAAELSNATVPFQSLGSFVREMRKQVGGRAPVTGNLINGHTVMGRAAFLTAKNAPVDTVFTIDKKEFLIGKTPGAADGVINYSRAVSRIHCKILRRDNQYCVVDLGSSNGTYLNGARLPANTQFPLEDGSVLRLADSEFYVTI